MQAVELSVNREEPGRGTVHGQETREGEEDGFVKDDRYEENTQRGTHAPLCTKTHIDLRINIRAG